MSDFDVIIVGGGIAGASLGAAIAGERRTLIVEAEEHCGYHSTGRSAAFYLESYGGPAGARLAGGAGPRPGHGGACYPRGARPARGEGRRSSPAWSAPCVRNWEA